MRTRLLITFLLVVSITTTTISRPSVIKDDSIDGKQETTLTPEEEQEARETAERFVKGYKEKRDLDALIDEMFISDYAERLQLQNLRHPFILVQEDVPLLASPEELRSFYVALMNLWSLMMELQEASECAQKPDGCEESGPEKIFPADVLKFIKSDPRLARFISSCIGETISSEQTTGNQDSSTADEAEERGAFFFRDTQELCELTNALEKTVALMRSHLLKLPQEKKAQSDSQSEDEESIHPHPTILSEDDDFYGYPAGSRLICVQVMLFHLDLVRVDGRLVILTVSPLTDSD